MQERGWYNGLGYLYNIQMTTIEVPNKNETLVFIIHTYIVLSRKRNDLRKRNMFVFIIKTYYMHKIIKNKIKIIFYEFFSL